DFAEAGADLLVVHAETATHLPRTLEQIKRLGLRCGVALNPATPLCCLDYILPDLDLVLLMSVNPGFGGQRFMPSTYAKIARLKQMIASIPPGAEAAAAAELMIQIDGGVDPLNAPLLVSAGAEVLVSGSAFFNFPPYAQRLKIFQDAVAQKC
ncbi:MAG: ribulose-phosphate 3-epimerase, partial [Deltaproteobacteria bacterium]|nr:ribulose-phosphate 3-epimerase [Deltaproteobacteria bacterium]